MRSRASLLLVAAATGCVARQAPAPPPPPPAYAGDRDVVPQGRAAVLPPEAGSPAGPAGTAGAGAAANYDAVGYASWYGEELEGRPTASGAPFASGAISAAHRTLPLGSYAEVTSLDTGRTILVAITDRGPSRPDREIDLSRGAARLLGTDARPMAAVRVRSVTAGAADVAALRAGGAASARLDTPEGVLRALRRQLSNVGAPRGAGDRPPARARPTAARPAPARSAEIPLEAPGFAVQVAAFGSEARARVLARSLRGFVEPAGGLWRVKLGPFADMPSAQRARDGAVSRGYGDAAIVVAP